MSLTSFLSNISVRKKLREELNYPKYKNKTSPKAPPLTSNYSIVGTAFDYL